MMPKRVFWLLLAIVLPILVLSSLAITPGLAQETAVPQAALHDVVINEWSQGNGGSKEWVELLVVNGPIDMRGWDLGDSSAGDLSFNDSALWSAVPSGSLIVVYNGDDPDTGLPPDDTVAADCHVVVPHNNAAQFNGDWPQFSNSNTNDNPQLRDNAAAIIHNFSAEPGSGRHPQSGENAQFNGASANEIGDPAHWSNNAHNYATPGNGNDGVNKAWIDSLCRTAPTILIDAVLYDGYESGNEAILLRNVGNSSANIGDWQLNDNESSTAVLPANTILPPNGSVWVAQNSQVFRRQFGFAPDIVPAKWPLLADGGDEVVLLNALNEVVDALVYEDGNDTRQIGWSGTAVYPYNGGSLFGQDGQILYRRRDQATGLPVPDTDTAADWAQATGDAINGRKPRYPGWDLDEFFFTTRVTETAVLTVAIAPDNAYEAIVDEINRAATSLNIEALTFENVAIGEALIQAANRGVSVTVLLEGSPVGGLPDQEKYICQELEAADGRCWFMISDDARKIFDRYRFLHAKFILVDGRRVIISSENLSSNSLPDDDKSDGTWGRRGVVLITDAPGVVGHVQTIFDRDFDLTNHVDISNTVYIGPPPVGFVPITETGGITYTVRYPAPASFAGTFAFELVQSPENSLRDQDGLLGLVNRAGSGDTILVQQLGERPYWGPSSSNSIDDPNPRLEAYINAAQRGAAVRILLDEYFASRYDPVSNYAACHYVKEIAQAEHLTLDCALGNPTGLGIHNKMVLAQIGGQGYVHVGSLNGSEQSSKGNRELALQVQSDGAYVLLAEMFNRDWPYRNYLPIVLNNFIGPANHILISEVLYNSPGNPDNAEFIELVNPTGSPIDISAYSLGDAVNPSDYEDVRRFPNGTILAAHDTLIVATTAVHFNNEYGINPNFEILDTDPTVPDLIDDPSWGDTGTYLQLGNAGDEVILRSPIDAVVDVVVYGAGSYPGITACPLTVITNASLERRPYWRDTDDCAADFQENPFPTPGALPY
ncbi:MAG: hypothetical protein GY803_06625 [Chloroflexi bacterium]|nr:hypothetical protein [Chloroflexota bacterium]